MKDGYTDEWGYERVRADFSDWSDYEPWQYWSTQFEWKQESTIQEQDIVAFRDNVRYELPDYSTLYKKAARFNIARVANIAENNIYLEIIHSEGEAPFLTEERIKMGREWLFQYGLYRWPRSHSPTENVTPEQKERGRVLKEKRDIESRFMGSGSGKRKSGGCSSAFTRVARKTRKQKSPPTHTL